MPKKQPKDGAVKPKPRAKPKATAKRKPATKRKKPAKAATKPAAEPRKPTGRPSGYSQKMADQICAELADGKSLRTVCLSEDMPCKATVFSWLRIYPEFLDQYTRAKEESADAMFEEVQDIADDGTNDWMEKHDGDGNSTGYALNGEHVQRSKLRIDTRKWMMAKMKPKKYGDRIHTEVSVSPEFSARLDAANARIAQLAKERKATGG